MPTFEVLNNRERMRLLVYETRAFYETHPRSMMALPTEDDPNRTSCAYFGPDGTKCALGRCLRPELEKEIREKNLNMSGAEGLVGEFAPDVCIDDLLQEPYRGFPLHFWEHLQDLHDDRSYWGTIGGKNVMTDEGSSAFKALVGAVAGGDFDAG